MSVLAIGTCLIITAAAQMRMTAPKVFGPFLAIGRHSYEIYLTHMFVVFAAFDLFLKAGKPLLAVPLFFLAVILVGSMLGGVVARLYSEPLNRVLRHRFGRQSRPLGSVVDAAAAAG